MLIKISIFLLIQTGLIAILIIAILLRDAGLVIIIPLLTLLIAPAHRRKNTSAHDTVLTMGSGARTPPPLALRRRCTRHDTRSCLQALQAQVPRAPANRLARPLPRGEFRYSGRQQRQPPQSRGRSRVSSCIGHLRAESSPQQAFAFCVRFSGHSRVRQRGEVQGRRRYVRCHPDTCGRSVLAKSPCIDCPGSWCAGCRNRRLGNRRTDCEL